jgi:hypothetical protein
MAGHVVTNDDSMSSACHKFWKLVQWSACVGEKPTLGRLLVTRSIATVFHERAGVECEPSDQDSPNLAANIPRWTKFAPSFLSLYGGFPE